MIKYNKYHRTQVYNKVNYFSLNILLLCFISCKNETNIKKPITLKSIEKNNTPKTENNNNTEAIPTIIDNNTPKTENNNNTEAIPTIIDNNTPKTENNNTEVIPTILDNNTPKTENNNNTGAIPTILDNNTFPKIKINEFIEHGLSIKHCENCGIMLIGSARIFSEAIKWTLDNNVDIKLTAAYGSGFTGQVNYLQEHSQSGWDFSDSSNVFLEKAEKNLAINLYYSPDYSGKKEYEALYYIYESNVPTIISKLIKGEGKIDLDSPNTAITLSIGGYTTGYEAVPCSDGTKECFEIFIPKNQSINFDVSPQINYEALKRLQLDPQNHQHSIVKLVTSRQNDCPLYSFIDSIETPNNFQLSDYFHYLDGNGPKYTQQTCQQRSYSFLVSNKKSFKFVVTNKDNRDKDYTVDYTFYIGGHYDFKSLNKWKDSRKIFRLHSTVLPH